MAEPTASSPAPAPLTHLRVLDLSRTRGSYAARLLADLGARVTRLEGTGAEPNHGPTDGPQWTFLNLSKDIELVADTGARANELLPDTDILVTDLGPAELAAAGLSDLDERFPTLIHLSVSDWGLDGPDADRPATDLTLLAASGLLSLAGEPGREPVRAVPEQSSIASSLHGTVGALIALLERDGLQTADSHSGGSGRGQRVDVSAQEALAHSLENAAQYVDLEGILRRRTGSAPSEAGSGLFACADGYVYLVAGIGGVPLAWPGFIEWLRGNDALGAAEEFSLPIWQDRHWRRTPEATTQFRDSFEAFSATRTKVELCEGGQGHGVSISPVSTPADLLASEQLRSRSFFRTFTRHDGSVVEVPGPPYRISDADLGPYHLPHTPHDRERMSTHR